MEDEWKDVRADSLHGCVQLQPLLGGRPAEAGGGQAGARGQVRISLQHVKKIHGVFNQSTLCR